MGLRNQTAVLYRRGQAARRQYKRLQPMLGSPRAAYAVAAKTENVTATWSGSPHPIHLRVRTSDVDTFHEVLLGEEYAFPFAAAPSTIIDAGANIGLTSIWLATRYPDARIVAIEAERTNFEVLRQNVKPFTNVTPVHAALWSHHSTIAVGDPNDWGPWAFQTSEITDDRPGRSGTVEALSVADVMERFGLDHVDLLKVDIEGAELEVFSAADRRWLKSVDAIAIELHDRLRPGCARAFFASLGDDFPVEESKGMNTFVARAPLVDLTRPSAPVG